MHTFVVVSGLPGSGKTTLASALAESLRFQHLDKDHFLEAHFLSETRITLQRRGELSRQADDELKTEALLLQSAVLSSWWRHPNEVRDSGTPLQWLLEDGNKVIEVFCQCSAELAARRFAARQRHAGHLDALRSQEELLQQLIEAEKLGPLFPKIALVCNTSTSVQPASISALANKVKVLVGAASEA
jgi:predicted kinase